jgi:hypothetical protein
MRAHVFAALDALEERFAAGGATTVERCLITMSPGYFAERSDIVIAGTDLMLAYRAASERCDA